MNCCYPRLRIHVDITEIDTPDDENLIREQHDMVEEDERMLSIRKKERRNEEDIRRHEEDKRRNEEVEQREEEISRIISEVAEYNRYQSYQDVRSIYYLHPLTIDNQLYRRIKEEDRWKEEDLRCKQEDLRRKQEDLRRKQEDQPSQTRKKYARRILVKSKRRTSEKKYTFQELIQLMKPNTVFS
jgi:hypothetical protein